MDKKFLVCIDSDGCLFDNMELKHKECFTPASVNVWGLQSISRYAREVCDYVNLYSHLRGENRFPSIVDTLDLLAQRPEVLARGWRKPDLTMLRRFIKESPSLSRNALEAFIAQHGEAPDLMLALRWSDEVNENVKRIAHDVAPFPAARAALEKLHERAVVTIVSQAQTETLRREWGEQGLLPFVDAVNGQEVGSKADCIRKAREAGFNTAHTLMIGDAPGDAAAAEAGGALFYPIRPGHEEESWMALDDLMEKFFTLEYAGSTESALLKEYHRGLLSAPPWMTMEENNHE